MAKQLFLFFLITALFTVKARAQYAVGGTSENYNSVYWLTWNPNLGDPGNPLELAPPGFGTNIVSGVYTWMYSSDIRIVASVFNLNPGELEPYTPGNWRGDGLGYLYSGAIDGGNLSAPQGVPYSGMATPNGVLAQFEININVEFRINGSWTPVNFPGIVIADAEELNGNTEYMAARTNGPTAWQLMDLRVNPDGTPEQYFLHLTNSGSDFKLQAEGGTDSGTQAVMYAHGATSLPLVEMRGGGKSALAIGFVFPFDLGDAPVSYGDNVKHYIDSFYINEHFPFDGKHTVKDYPVTQLAPRASVFIGADNVDADGMGALQSGSDADGANNDQYTGAADEETIVVSSFPIKANQDGDLEISFPVTNAKPMDATVYMWMDFDSNGRFEQDELVQSSVPPSVTNHQATAVFPVGMFAGDLKAGPLYSRIRMTTSYLQDDPATPEFDERSTALAADGETEDYRFTVEGVEITGTVLHDPTGATDDLIAGQGIGVLDGTQLYAYLLADTVLQKQAIAADGTYTFSDVNPGNYTVAISTTDAEIGSTLDPDSALPNKWLSVGANYGENNEAWVPGTSDIIDNGKMQVAIVIPMDGTDISGVNFAAEQAPTAGTIDILSSPARRKLVLTETDLLNYMSDPEDVTIDFPSLLLFDPVTDSFAKEITIAGEGTYAVVLTGTTITLEFQPIAGFSGATTRVGYLFEDAAGLSSNLGTIDIKIEAPTLIITNPMLYQKVN